MFHAESYTGTKEEKYESVTRQLWHLIEDESAVIANLANASALLNAFLPDINWVGFYLWKEDQLVLGPFQGLPACIRIPAGKGVCGTAARTRETVRVADVHLFPGHIACDAASNSEIVIPLLTSGGKLIGVLDIDSPLKKRFDDADQAGLERFCERLAAQLETD